MSDERQVESGQLKAQLAAGVVAKVERSELLLPDKPDPVFSAKDASGAELPVYVEVGKCSPMRKNPSAQLATDEGGKQHVLINEDYHKWSEEYVRKNIANTDAELSGGFNKTQETFITRIKTAISSGKYNGPSLEGRDIDKGFKEFMGSVADQAKEKGVEGLQIHITPIFTPTASAETSRENNQYIFINGAEVMQALSSDQYMKELKATVGHEISHIANGETSARGVAKAHNDGEYKTHELLADLGANQPEGIAAHNKRNLMYAVASYNS